MKEITAILEHTLPKEQHWYAQVQMGTRGGYNLRNAKKSSPIDRLFRARRIDLNQKAAGDRIERLAHDSGIYCPSGMALGERVGGSFERCMTGRQVEAWEQYFDVSKEIQRWMGSEGLQAVIAVCVYGEAPFNLGFIPVNKRIAKVVEGLEIAHKFWLKPRE